MDIYEIHILNVDKYKYKVQTIQDGVMWQDINVKMVSSNVIKIKLYDTRDCRNKCINYHMTRHTDDVIYTYYDSQQLPYYDLPTTS